MYVSPGSDCGGDDFLRYAGPRALQGFGTLEWIESRVGYRRRPCPSETAGQAHVYCAVIRGRVQPIRVFVDGQFAAGGLEDAGRYPLASIYMVEVSRDRSTVSVVTNRAMDEAAREYLRHSRAIP
ncbi:MAG TPA: hypothetical protein VFJ16_13065 [Longimicrobium sp.]|nr:hypothetical protein [Longimicrobium sp.]